MIVLESAKIYGLVKGMGAQVWVISLENYNHGHHVVVVIIITNFITLGTSSIASPFFPLLSLRSRLHRKSKNVIITIKHTLLPSPRGCWAHYKCFTIKGKMRIGADIHRQNVRRLLLWILHSNFCCSANTLQKNFMHEQSYNILTAYIATLYIFSFLPNNTYGDLARLIAFFPLSSYIISCELHTQR